MQSTVRKYGVVVKKCRWGVIRCGCCGGTLSVTSSSAGLRRVGSLSVMVNRSNKVNINTKVAILGS